MGRRRGTTLGLRTDHRGVHPLIQGLEKKLWIGSDSELGVVGTILFDMLSHSPNTKG